MLRFGTPDAMIQVMTTNETFVNVYTSPTIELDYEAAGTYPDGSMKPAAFVYEVKYKGTLWGKGTPCEYTSLRGRRSGCDSACAIAQELAESWGGTVYLRGVPFVSSRYANERRARLMSARNVKLLTHKA